MAPALSSTTIAGHAVTLTRMGMQYPLSLQLRHRISGRNQPLNPIGRIEMYYEITPGIWTGVVNYCGIIQVTGQMEYVPNAGTNVTIPAGTPNDCWVPYQ